MPAVKRKRPHDAPATGGSEPRKSAAQTPIPVPSAPPISRRATRSIAPLPVQQELELPRRRRRVNANRPLAMTTSTTTSVRPLEPRGKENIPIGQPPQPLKPARNTRHSGPSPVPLPVDGINRKKAGVALTPVPIPVIPLMPERTMRQPDRPPAATNTRQVGRPAASTLVLPPHEHKVGRSQPITIATSTVPQRSQSPTRPSSRRASGQNGRPSGGPQQEPDRNIDKVVLGNICFRAWYPSYYGKEVLGDCSGSHCHGTKGGKDGKGDSMTSGAGGESHDGSNGAKTHGRRDRDNPPILERLYVCPCCFKYSKELVTWCEHVRVCEKRGFVPGNKIYVHPKGQRTVLVPSGPVSKPTRGKRTSGSQKVVEEVIQDEGEWSIWEVDGAKDVLFCQNLSLFAKLFLDNKSVFFDVTGFNYFLLVYTPPSLRPPFSGADTDTNTILHRPHIVGFFSKEKMSWDNNNLACILIFPPWQRKGLGALLMGVSYEISRREGILGGPEKPISDLGKKGYKRFWAGEIARWLLGLYVKMDGSDETVVDIVECSQATWIAPEDCLLVLREMGVAEDAGKGPPRPKKPVVEENGVPVPGEAEEVQRVKISHEAVRSWVKKQGISLERSCDPGGFVDGYAMKPAIQEGVS